MDIQSVWTRCVALVDMQAFFPSCEKVDFPELKDKPVVVINGNSGTTIISSCYIARSYGIRTGMHLKEAYSLCPDIVIRSSRPNRYSEISANIMNAIKNITPDVEVFSIDECFMDLKPVLSLYKSVENIATLIRKTVFEISGGIVCSIGISEGKLTAKFCAGLNKGKTTIVPANQIKDYIANHDLSRMCGIGPSLVNYLNSKGYYKCGDLEHAPKNLLSSIRGDTGARLQSACLGHDPVPVNTKYQRPKSIGHSKVLPPKTTNRNQIEGVLHQLAHRLTRRLRSQDFITPRVAIFLQAQRHCIKKVYNFEQNTSSDTNFNKAIIEHLKLWKGEPLYKVGLACDKLYDKDKGQIDMFTTSDSKSSRIDAVKDAIANKFGKDKCRYATELNADDMNMVPVIAFNFDATSKNKNSL